MYTPPLQERLASEGLFEELESLYRSLQFGFAILDEREESLQPVMWSESFM
jgi:hypothetical protein